MSFTVEPGEIVGFLGPNGAGKTTTMRILSGYKVADGGNVTVAGFDVLRNPLAVKSRMGYLPESVPLYPEMRVKEYLRYRGKLKGLRGAELRMRFDEVVAACDLGEVKRKLIGHLSKGFRQRVGLADALIAAPEVLILDEPMIGLDPNQTRMIRGLISGLSGKHTVLLSSHILTEIESVCDRVIIINRGRIVASDSPANLASALKRNVQVIVEIKGNNQAIADKLSGLPEVESVNTMPLADGWASFVCVCRDNDDEVRAAIFKLVGKKRWDMRELRSEQCHLEDVFVEMTNADNGSTSGRDSV